MKKVIVYHNAENIIAISTIEESDISPSTFDNVENEYFVVDDSPLFNNKLKVLKVNTASNPKEVYLDGTAADADLLEQNKKVAVEWKKGQLALIDWSQTSLSAAERKLIMSVVLSDAEKLEVYNAWVQAGSPQ